MIIKRVLKTGMKNEYDICKAHADSETLVLTGQQTVEDLEKNVPSTAKGILSVGMMGGLDPMVTVGNSYFCGELIDGNNKRYEPTKRWNDTLRRIGYTPRRWFSNGQYNTANTPKEKAEFYAKYKADCIDDETLWVAQFALKHGLEWTCIRNCSDSANDDVEITRHLLNAAGNVEAWEVIKAFTTHPGDMIKIWENYNKSNAGLGSLAVNLSASKWGLPVL